MSAASADVVIVGGGIVGAYCALECARGGLSVIVVDRAIAGGGATAANMGHLALMDDSEAQFQLTHHSQRMWAEAAGEMPVGAEYMPCGTIWVAADEEEMGEVRRKLAFCRGRGVAAEELDSQQLAETEPNLRQGLAGGLLLPDDSILYPPVVTRWLLERSGATLILGKSVVALDDTGARLEDGTVVTGGVLVNAAGADASRLTPGVPVAPRKGHLVITDRYPGFIRHELVELGYLKSAHSGSADSVAFNAQPRMSGQVLIGSSRQYGAAHPEIDRGILSRMLSRAVEYMPEIADLNAIRCWTGFRPATPDGLPLIGPCPGYQRVWLATGHEGLGITTAPATARLLAEMILGRAPSIPGDPYLPARYAARIVHA